MAVSQSGQSSAVARNPKSPGRILMEIHAAIGKTLFLVVADGFRAAHIEELFNSGHPYPTVPVPDNLIYVGDAGDLIQLSVTEAVKPAGVLLHESTDPERVLPILINGPHIRGFKLENTQHARAVAMQAAIPGEPYVAIARLGNRANIRHAWKLVEALPIEPIEEISAQPDAAFAILKYSIKACIREALVLSIRYQGSPSQTNQPQPIRSNPHIAFAIRHQAPYLEQFPPIR